MSDGDVSWKLAVLQERVIQLVGACREVLVEIEKLKGGAPGWSRTPDLVEAELFDGTLLDDVPLTARVAHCLRNEGYRTVGDVMGLSDRDLLGIPNFGRKSLAEVRGVLLNLEDRA